MRASRDHRALVQAMTEADLSSATLAVITLHLAGFQDDEVREVLDWDRREFEDVAEDVREWARTLTLDGNGYDR